MGRLVSTSLEDIRSQLWATFTAERPPRQIALSFAFGLFLISLPNMGVSLLALGVIGFWITRADPRAFSAAAVLLNPLVKSGVYVVSLGVGILLLGPIPGGFSGPIDLTVGFHALVRLLVGNLLIAIALGVGGYVVAIYAIHVAAEYDLPG